MEVANRRKLDLFELEPNEPNNSGNEDGLDFYSTLESGTIYLN